MIIELGTLPNDSFELDFIGIRKYKLKAEWNS